MKNFLWVVFTFLSITGFTQKTDFKINLDSVKRIIIIDHQNFNYEWYCGRIYHITRNNGTYNMRLVEQYNKPYFFGESEPVQASEPADISETQLHKKLNLSISQDSALNLANRVVAAKHNYWAERIKVENSKIPVDMPTIDDSKLHDLVNTINDRRSGSPRYILQNLGMDSSWIAANAGRLFESYKLPEPEPTPAQRNYCISCFLDKKKAMRASFSLIGSHNTSDYPYIEIQFLDSEDTLNIYTDNPYPLSMPWILEDSIKYYNPKISMLIAELLPEKEHSNKRRLSGDYSISSNYKSIEEAFAKSVLYQYCTVINAKKKSKRKRLYIDKKRASVKPPQAP